MRNEDDISLKYEDDISLKYEDNISTLNEDEDDNYYSPASDTVKQAFMFFQVVRVFLKIASLDLCQNCN